LEAESAQEVLKMLSEGDYESSMSNVGEPADFETALNTERERVYSLIDELSLDPRLTEIFRARWDFHNLKVLLKSSYLGESEPTTDDALIDSGLIPIEELRSGIESEDERGSVDAGERGSEESSIKNALQDAQAAYDEDRNPQMIDFVIDNHLQSFLYQRAADYPNAFVRGYFEAVADLTNIKSFIRIKMLGESVRLLDAVLLPYGSLDKEIYTSQLDETVENFAADLTSTPYAELAAEGIRRWSEEHSLAAYERLSDDYLINYIKPAKYIVFGVEPLIAYLLAKEHEMKLIRIIVVGKLNDLPAEAIKDRLRDTYV
jgi:V/A-type H+-transporting ATPase subunit C